MPIHGVSLAFIIAEACAKIQWQKQWLQIVSTQSNLYADIWVCVLSVFFGFTAVLDCKLWTAVQTAKAHHTLFLNPNRTSVLYLDCLHRAFLCAPSAANAAILYQKMSGSTHLFVINRFGNPFRDKCRGTGGHMTVCSPLLYAADYVADLCLCFLCILCNFLRSGKVKNRRPCVHHPNRIVSVDLSPLNRLVRHMTGSSRDCSVGGDEIQIFGMKRGSSQNSLTMLGSPQS